MSDEHSLELLAIRKRHLHHLEKQQASKGIDTEFYIADQINQLRAEIERLQHYSHIYRFQGDVQANKRPDPMPGLIALVSTEDIPADARFLKQSAYDAIEYHLRTLKVCWLIATSGKRSSLGAAQWLESYCNRHSIATRIWQIQEPMSVEETFQTVRLIFNEELAATKLRAGEIIVDITGATKPMSVGAFLASQDIALIQYMVRPEDRTESFPVLIRSLPEMKEQPE